MTCKDKIKDIINKHDFSMDADSWEKLVYLAYYMGREEATKSVSDEYSKLLSEQKARAKECRYYKMAMHVQGNYDYLYTSDYSGDMTSLFGNDETDL